MKNSGISLAYRIFIARWVAMVVRRARLVVCLTLVSTIGIAVYLVNNLAINTNTADMLSSDLPFRQISEEIDSAFPQTESTLIVVIDGQSADMVDEAALRLGKAMHGMPEIFRNVYDLKGDPFFQRNGLLYLDLKNLNELIDRLAESQPFLGALWRDPTLRGLFHMLQLAINEKLEFPVKQLFKLEDALVSIAKVAEAQSAGQIHLLSWTELIRGHETSAPEKRRIIVVQPDKNYALLQPAKVAINEIRKLARSLGLTPERGITVRLTGSVALNNEELESVKKGMGIAAILSFVLVLSLLFIAFRRSILVFVCLITLLVGLIWTAGFATFTVANLNLLSVAFAVLFIGLSVDFGIHFVLRFREKIRQERGVQDALVEVARGLGGTLTLCAASAAIAFYAFFPTDYKGLAELGLIAGTGMFIALFANLTVLPALIKLCPPKSVNDQQDPASAGLSFVIWDWIISRANWVCGAALIFGVIGAALIPRIGFDFDPLNLKDPSTESVSTLRDLMANGNRNQHAIEILAKNLEVANILASRLRKLETVGEVVTLTDFVPKEQDEKLAIIGLSGMMIMPALSVERRSMVLSNSERYEAWVRFSEKLKFTSTSQSGSLSQAANRLLSAVSRLLKTNPNEAALMEFENRLLAGLQGRIDILRKSLGPEEITLDNLPAALRDRKIAADGRALIKIIPKSNLENRDALRVFVDEVRAIYPDAAGSPVVILEAGNTVLKAFFQAFVLSVCGVLILLWFILRNVREIVLVFAPLLLSGFLTIAAAAIIGQAFNFANVIVLPLLFGLGVAGGIHVVDRTRGNTDIARTLRTSTPRAVFFSALTTIGSFGSISLSAHPGTSSMGILLTLALFMSLVSTLIFLPALLTLLSGTKLHKRF